MTDRPLTVLHIAHNHPAFHAGGTELFAAALHAAMARAPDIRSHFLAAVLPRYMAPQPGTHLAGPDMTGPDFLLAGGRFDPVCLSQADTFGVLRSFADLLAALRPDVVHLHHVLQIGLEALVIARRVRPRARLVLTLHDFHPLCHRDGLMLKPDGRLCDQSTPRACALCFPDVGVVNLRLRELHVRRAFEAVDRFVAPSRALRDRYLDWGLPAEAVTVIPNGYAPPAAAAGSREAPGRGAGRPVRFGFFGHINRAKGVPVVLEAARHLLARGERDFTVHLHGADTFAPADVRDAVQAALADLAPHVIWHGAYDHRRVLDLMARMDWVLVPSVWWENDPLVIQEAFLARRPVLCSDIGGMAEAVPHGIAGYHVPVGDPAAWADAMAAVLRRDGPPPVWTFPPPRDMDACVRAYRREYRP